MAEESALQYKADAVRIKLNDAITEWENTAFLNGDPVQNFRVICNLAYLLRNISADVNRTVDLAHTYLVGRGVPESVLNATRQAMAADAVNWFENVNGRTQELLASPAVGRADESYRSWSEEPEEEGIKVPAHKFITEH